MRAVRFHEFGGPLQVDEVDEPVVGDGDVIVDIADVAVNPLDVWVRLGNLGRSQPLPFVTGVEASGHVDGRPVVVRGAGFGGARQGLAAERVAAPRDSVHPVPAGLDLAQAAALGVAGVTAVRVVQTVGEVGATDRVVVLGASGGVGQLAVQLSVVAGAEVWGQTSSEAKVGAITGAGARHAVVGDAAAVAGQLADIAPTVVIDSLGGDFTRVAADALAPGGRLVVFGTSADPTVTFDLRAFYRKSGRILGYSGMTESPAELTEALRTTLDLAASGVLRVHVDEALPFERAMDAHRRILDRQVTGKLVLHP